MPDANGAEGPNTVGFLDLSRELRDQVYRELLFQPIGYGAARQRHKFETSILRVNEQIYQEASKVLYEENAWVVFEIRCPGLILGVPSDRYLITISRDVSAGRLPFGGIPSLRVRMQDDLVQRRKYIDYVIIPLEWVRDMTRIFVRGNMIHMSDYLKYDEFIVHLHETRKHESRRRMAMEFLEIIRGVGKAKIYGLPSPLNVSFAKHMRTPVKSIDELIDRTSMYMRHAELMRAQGEFYHAEELYDQAHDSSIWAAWPAFIANAAPTKSKIFKSQLYESLEGSALCSLRHGDCDRACDKLKDYIMENSDLPDSQKATGFYYYGLASVAAGFDNKALFGFMQALMLILGYEAVDKEVDALEDRVDKGTTLRITKEMVVKNMALIRSVESDIARNLELVRPCRHKNAGDRELPQEQKNKMIGDFRHCMLV